MLSMRRSKKYRNGTPRHATRCEYGEFKPNFVYAVSQSKNVRLAAFEPNFWLSQPQMLKNPAFWTTIGTAYVSYWTVKVSSCLTAHQHKKAI